MINKTITRIAAIQAVYQYHFMSDYRGIDDILDLMIKLYQNKEIDFVYDNLENKNDIVEDSTITIKISYFKSVVKYTIENIDSIDLIIHDKLAKSNLSNMHITIIALLRVAVSELILYKNAARNMIISEFTDIASCILAPAEVGFVNSIIENLAKENFKMSTSQSPI